MANTTGVLQPRWLIVLILFPPPVWTFLHSPPGTPTSPTTWEIVVVKGGTMWARISRKFCLTLRLPRQFRDLLHPQICDMGPTALLPFRRKACWGFFRPEKSWQLWPGLNPRTWVLKGSTLTLDHQSHLSRLGGSSIFLINVVRDLPHYSILLQRSWQ